MRIDLHWKGLSSPPVNPTYQPNSRFPHSIFKQIYCSLGPHLIFFFVLFQRGLEIIDGVGSFTLDHSVLKLETFPHLFQWFGALRFVYIKKLSWLLMGRCCMKMCHNWCKWDMCPPHPPILFMSMRWGALHPPWSLHTGFRAFKRGPLKLWSSTWVRKNIFFALHCAQETNVFTATKC